MGFEAGGARYIWHGSDNFGYEVYAFKAYDETSSGVPTPCTWDDLLKSKYKSFYSCLEKIMLLSNLKPKDLFKIDMKIGGKVYVRLYYEKGILKRVTDGKLQVWLKRVEIVQSELLLAKMDFDGQELFYEDCNV